MWQGSQVHIYLLNWKGIYFVQRFANPYHGIGVLNIVFLDQGSRDSQKHSAIHFEYFPDHIGCIAYLHKVFG